MKKSTLIRAALVLVLLVALVVLLTDGGDDGEEVVVGEPQIVSAEQLSDFVGDRDSPVYWLGPRDGTSYELEETASGEVQLRYLDADAEAGDGPGRYVTVVTYPAGDGVAALRRSAGSEDGVGLGETADGAVLLIDRDSPRNAHLAYPGDEVHIEVFDPVVGEAAAAASRGDVQQVP